jgi:hypothetical protein
LEKSVSGTSDNTSYKPTTTTSTYDPTGRRVALAHTTPLGDSTISPPSTAATWAPSPRWCWKATR